MNKVSIVGSGWLGLATALAFVQKGFHVKASTTTPAKQEALKQKGVAPYLLNLDDHTKKAASDFFLSDILIITLPVSASIEIKKQLDRLEYLLLQTKAKHLIYISSTSVYGEKQGVVSEETKAIPTSPSGIIQLQLEERLLKEKNLNIAIIRSAGQYGPDRHPGRFLANKENVANPNAPVNMIHQKDLVEIILQIVLQNKIRGREVYNAVASSHPTRKEFYTKASELLALTPPLFTTNEADPACKMILGQKIRETIKIHFNYDDLAL